MTEEIKGHIRGATRTFGGWIVLKVYVDPRVLKNRIFENANIAFRVMKKKLKNVPVYVGIHRMPVEEEKKISKREIKSMKEKVKRLEKAA